MCRLSKQATRDQALLRSNQLFLRPRSRLCAESRALIRGDRLQRSDDRPQERQFCFFGSLVGLASYDMKLHPCFLLSRSISPWNGAVAAIHHLSASVCRIGSCVDASVAVSERLGSTVGLDLLLCMRLVYSCRNQIGILERHSLTVHSASTQETSNMDPRAPAGQQLSSQPLSGDWSSGPVQTQQGPDGPAQQATQALPGTSRPKTTFFFATVNRQSPIKILFTGTPASSSSQLLPSSQQQQPQQPYQQSPSPQPNPTHGQSGSGQSLNKDQQKWAGYDHTKEGPASATSQKAQAALDAVAKGPTNKTDPDKVNDHEGFGATDTGPGEANREDQGTTGLTGNADASVKGSWLTQLIGNSTAIVLCRF